MPTVLILMGVSGSGKSSVGEALADALACPFFDGDDFHPPENVAKMSRGIPLNDDDRYPWLARLHDLIAEHLARGEGAVVACSALKAKYRQQLLAGNKGAQIIHLSGSFELIYGRMQQRQHFMSPEMLRSQFAALEPPDPAQVWVVDIDRPVAAIVAAIRERIAATEQAD